MVSSALLSSTGSGSAAATGAVSGVILPRMSSASTVMSPSHSDERSISSVSDATSTGAAGPRQANHRRLRIRVPRRTAGQQADADFAASECDFGFDRRASSGEASIENSAN